MKPYDPFDDHVGVNDQLYLEAIAGFHNRYPPVLRLHRLHPKRIPASQSC